MRAVDERQMDRLIGGLLRAGVLASALLVLIGVIVSLGQGGMPVAAYRSFPGAPGNMRTMGAILGEALRGNGRGIVQLGVLVLVATPIARVVLSVVAFAVQGDGVYVCVTLVVLAVLGVSLFGPIAPEHGPAARDVATAAGSAPQAAPPRSPVEPARMEAVIPSR